MRPYVYAILAFCLMSSAARADHTRTWHIHKKTEQTLEITPAKVDAWHTEGTTRLQTDDDGCGDADRSAALTLTRGETTGGWEYGDRTTANDDVIDDDEEASRCFAAMRKNSVVLTSVYNGALGHRDGDKVMIFGNPDCSTLVHELGHIAKCPHADVDKRFMTPYGHPNLTSGVTGRKYVSAVEMMLYIQLH